ncbi:MAG: zinc ribbon domain-containing protein [Acetobacteraceae bacterium]|nr:zinc ribbon domain-containing protein [Acetobacteraceae bacterium]
MVSTRREFVTATIRSAVVIVMLLIVRVVIARLPMLQEIMPMVNFDLASLLDTLVMTGVIATIAAFGFSLDRHLSRLVTGFPRAGQLAKLLAVIIAVAVAYFSYRYVVLSLIPDLDWLYPIVFLVLFAIPMTLLCVAIYASIDDLTALFTGGRRPRAAQAALPRRCPACGTDTGEADLFCSSCGTKLPAREERRTCPACGAPLLEDAIFCASCGAKAETKGSEPLQPPRCPGCGAEAAPGAKFCRACGQALGAPASG